MGTVAEVVVMASDTKLVSETDGRLRCCDEETTLEVTSIVSIDAFI